ncbi:HEPN domain-containing protein [uncultured Stenotrophomonas sp.]|uniref:HEPN domain-containing protein n=1 Tax=uncultured Stenotrophomonas sp. TaxID=165438 RepID=UPI0028D66FCE|nr:HEPN domain-containing protein [uncultured Stenotrophomonas sp.]
MSISFPHKTRDKLGQALLEALRDCEVFSGSFVSLNAKCWTLHEAIPLGCRPEQALRLIAGDRHIADFVRSEISRNPPGKWDMKVKTTTLGLLLGEDGCKSLSERLIAGLESLPWSYKFYSEMAGEFLVANLGAGGELSLTPKLRLVSGAKLNEDLPGVGAFTQLSAAPGTNNHAGWTSDSIYVELLLNGFVAKDLESETIQDANDYLFSFYGLAIALKLMEFGNAWCNIRPPAVYKLKIFRDLDDSVSQVAQLDFDPSHAKVMHDLGVPRLWRGSNKPDEFCAAAAGVSRALLNANQRVLNAARWFFDSHSGSNLQVRFVQIATAFEILLGDREQSRETGLGTLMANRCAYMLGKNDSSRQKICDAFKAGYGIRSTIVHTGKTRLSSADLGHFYYMQELCAAVIRKECSDFLS